MMKDPTELALKPRKQPRQARAAYMVDVIMAAATRVLAADGVVRFTTNHVAEAAGISIGSLYQYFPNKHALLAELACREYERLLTMMRAAFAATETLELEAGVRGIVTATVDAMPAQAGLARLLMTDMASLQLSQQLTRRLDAVLGELMQLSIQHSRRFQSPQQSRDPAQTAAMCMTLCRSLVYATQVDQMLAMSREQLIEAITDQLLFTLGYSRPAIQDRLFTTRPERA